MRMKLYFRERGVGNEDYIFLDYNEESKEYSVVKGCSYRDRSSSSLAYKEKDTTYTLSEFLKKHPEYEYKVNELKQEIERNL